MLHLPIMTSFLLSLLAFLSNASLFFCLPFFALLIALFLFLSLSLSSFLYDPLPLGLFPFFTFSFSLSPTSPFSSPLSPVSPSTSPLTPLPSSYPDATIEELEAVNNVCIICREEMVSRCKKLPCNHIFHTTCLQSWFQRQQTCPTCRMDILNQNLVNHLTQVGQGGQAQGAQGGQQQPLRQQRPQAFQRQQNNGKCCSVLSCHPYCFVILLRQPHMQEMGREVIVSVRRILLHAYISRYLGRFVLQGLEFSRV